MVNKAFNKKDRLVMSGIKTGETALTGPYGVQIGVTGDCNYRCRFCAFFSNLNRHKKVKEERKKIPFDKILELIRMLEDMDVAQVSLVGWGEPLLHPDIIKIISCVKDHGLKCMLTSNASLLTEEKIVALIDLDLDMFNVSLNAGKNASYKKVHGISDNKKFSFDSVLNSLKTIKNLKEKKLCGKPIVGIRAVICRDTYKDVINIFNIAKDLGVNSVILQEWAFFDSSKEIGLNNDEIISLLSDIEGIQDNKNIHIVNNLDYFKNRLKRILSDKKNKVNLNGQTPGQDAFMAAKSMDYPCYVGWTYAMIMHNGDVLPCCNCTRPMGNIYDEPFVRIWNGDTYKKFRKDTLHINTVPFTDDSCLCYITCGSVVHNKRMHNMIHQKP